MFATENQSSTKYKFSRKRDLHKVLITGSQIENRTPEKMFATENQSSTKYKFSKETQHKAFITGGQIKHVLANRTPDKNVCYRKSSGGHEKQ
jgi:hypothetical protein